MGRWAGWARNGEWLGSLLHVLSLSVSLSALSECQALCCASLHVFTTRAQSHFMAASVSADTAIQDQRCRTECHRTCLSETLRVNFRKPRKLLFRPFSHRNAHLHAAVYIPWLVASVWPLRPSPLSPVITPIIPLLFGSVYLGLYTLPLPRWRRPCSQCSDTDEFRLPPGLESSTPESVIIFCLPWMGLFHTVAL